MQIHLRTSSKCRLDLDGDNTAMKINRGVVTTPEPIWRNLSHADTFKRSRRKIRLSRGGIDSFLPMVMLRTDDGSAECRDSLVRVRDELEIAAVTRLG